MSALALQLLESHDLRLVALATVVCALSAFAGITLIAHARRTHGPMHLVWLAIAAIAVGFGIWATQAVLGLGAGLDIPVVAEGVERQEELDFLRRESCASVQGFLIGRPQGIEHFAEQTSGRRAHLDGGARPPLRVVG